MLKLKKTQIGLKDSQTLRDAALNMKNCSYYIYIIQENKIF